MAQSGADAFMRIELCTNPAGVLQLKVRYLHHAFPNQPGPGRRRNLNPRVPPPSCDGQDGSRRRTICGPRRRTGRLPLPRTETGFGPWPAS